ncbi:MAG: hypothetical protein JWN14_1498 [Chthonomonadales bacterium]|nr:hypothetical protein [Chthonomonadales bacterium]
MKPRALRQFANRYGAVSLLLVGAYLLAWHLWTERRKLLLAGGFVLVLAGVGVLAALSPRYVSHGDYQLYLGHVRSEELRSPQPLEQRILGYWDDKSQTAEVQGLVQAFAQSVARKDRGRASEEGDRLCRLFQPKDLGRWVKDGKGLLRAVIGQIYLEQGRLPEAEHEFQSVLATVPPGEPHWGQSWARQMSTYGLAHSNALHASYGEALKWLARAPGEYNEGCGNANEAEAVANYPLKVVWTVARQPFASAEPELKAMMGGQFTPMESHMNGDTSAEQRQHAAAEAGLTLGCLYAQAGRYADAEACWQLVASTPTNQHEAADFARVLLARPH